MNAGRHAGAFANLFADLVAQNDVDAARTTEFFREYFAVLDLAAEFYLETVQQVFQESDWLGASCRSGANSSTRRRSGARSC